MTSVLILQRGKRTHVFWTENMEGKIYYLEQSRPFANKIYVISNTSHPYDVLFMLRKIQELRWTPELIIYGSKILCMIIENLHF